MHSFSNRLLFGGGGGDDDGRCGVVEFFSCGDVDCGVVFIVYHAHTPYRRHYTKCQQSRDMPRQQTNHQPENQNPPR